MQMEYELLESARARRLRITIRPDGRVVMTKPAFMPEPLALRFLEKRRQWIEKTLARIRRTHARDGAPLKLPLPQRDSAAYAAARKAARTQAAERLQHFNAHYGFRYGTLSIRDQKTRWGSCSARGALSFNYRIALLPSALADYVIVHELCHIKEHNHSKAFWALVAETVPDYAARRKELRRYALR